VALNQGCPYFWSCLARRIICQETLADFFFSFVEQELFAQAEPEPECISVSLYRNSMKKVTKVKIKNEMTSFWATALKKGRVTGSGTGGNRAKTLPISE
jgi:hypothetical protein